MSFELIIAVLLFVYAIFITFFCVKFGIKILKIQDSVENCLDVIDNSYSEISRILEIPVYYDSQEVKQVLQTIKEVQASFHDVAITISENFEPEDDT